ncbi:AraC family transcriptional regulator [Armatimonas sp.]|uniref:AraC family transcriptional regulator n=1 Tax=Armatimonas sp. TaxID=1872638 RepID=UPI00286A4281|nr:AraC family transcriptional regulator [Armatimonas sp.]
MHTTNGLSLFTIPNPQSTKPGPLGPTHVLHACGRRTYHWSGVGPLSLKLFFGGTGRYAVGRGQLVVEEGNYLILNHGQRYSITIEAAEPVESFCLFFRTGQLESVVQSLRAQADHLLDSPEAFPVTPPIFVERTYAPDTLLTPALLDLRRELAEREQASPLWLEERLNGILERLLVRHQLVGQEVVAFGAAAGIARPATREELYRRLYQARDFLEAEFAQPLTLEQLARVACLSPNHFLRSFRALFGTSPHQYLTERRLRGAKALLEHTDLPVTQVTLAVGFLSHGSFTRLFRSRVGTAPEIYRRRFR